MPKQFVVRLRRGSPTGTIVANSQVITFTPLNGTIYPSNFADGRLQGRLSTNNRVANFIKTMISAPTTTTTTTRAPRSLLTSTTTSRGPYLSTTTTSSTVRKWGLKFTPNIVSGGTTFSANITKPLGSVVKLYLGILRKNAPEIASNSIDAKDSRPSSQDFEDSGWIDRLQFTYIDITWFVNNYGQNLTSLTYPDIKLKNQLPWLIQDITTFAYLSETLDFARDNLVRTDLKIAYKFDPFALKPVITPSVAIINQPTIITLTGGPTINLNNNTPIKVKFRKKANKSEFYGGGYLKDTWVSNTGVINEYGELTLSANGSVQENATFGTEGIASFEFTFPLNTAWGFATSNVLIHDITVLNSLVSVSIFNGIKESLYCLPGETFTIKISNIVSDKYYAVKFKKLTPLRPRQTDVGIATWKSFSSSPSEGWYLGGSGSGMFAVTDQWWYLFKATSTNKQISLPFNSSIDFENLGYFSFVIEILEYETQKFLVASAETFLANPIIGYNVSISPQNAKILEGTDQEVKLSIYSKRPLIEEDFGSMGREYNISLSSSNNLITSNDITARFESGTNSLDVSNSTNILYPGFYNYRFAYQKETDKFKYFAVNLIIKAKSDSEVDGGDVNVKIFTYRREDIPSTNNFTSFFTNTNPGFLITSITSAFSILDSSTSNPVITNWTPSPITNQLNEVTSREFNVSFTVTDTLSRVIYLKCVGDISLSDFEGPATGQILTKNGSKTETISLKIKTDADIEGNEKFAIMFFLTQSDFTTNSNAFYISPEITIVDGSNSINEIIKIADVDIPPYYINSEIKLQILNGYPNDRVDISDGTTVFPAITLDSNGSSLFNIGPYNSIGTRIIEAVFKSTNHARYVTLNISELPKGVNISSGGCPDPMTAINISPTETRLAGELEVGDLIWTMHEVSLEYGYFSVTHVEFSVQPKLKFTFDDNSYVIVSLSHRFLCVNNEWVIARDLRHGQQVEGITGVKSVTSIAKQGLGTVVKLEINQAHTYVANGFISHNVKIDDRNTSFLI